MTKFFKKSKKTYSEAILGLFCPNSGKNDFSWKKGLWQFLDIPIVYHRAKKLSSHFLEKHQTNGRTDRETDGQISVIL